MNFSKKSHSSSNPNIKVLVKPATDASVHLLKMIVTQHVHYSANSSPSIYGQEVHPVARGWKRMVFEGGERRRVRYSCAL